MSVLFDPIYEKVLTSADWNFAIRDVELAQDVGTPTDPNYIYSYTLPADYLNAVRFYDTGGAAVNGYQIQKRKIYTNTTRLFSKYVQSAAIESLPAYFVHLLALELAVAAQEAIIAIGTVQQRLDGELAQQRVEARRLDNRENPQQDALAPSRYVRVRY